MDLLINILGWLGVFLLLLAFWLVSTRRAKGDSVLYQVLNLIGSGLLIINSGYYRALPSVGVNVVWIIIAIFTLARRKAGVSTA